MKKIIFISIILLFCWAIPRQGKYVKREAQNYNNQAIEESLSLNINLSGEKHEYTKERFVVFLDFCIEKSFQEDLNFYKLVDEINLIFSESDVIFKINTIYKREKPFNHYNLDIICKKLQFNTLPNTILINVVGKSGESIGKANLGGIFKNRAYIFANLSYFSNIKEKAYLVSHEIGHIFNLNHSNGNDIMLPSTEKIYYNFSKEQLSIINNYVKYMNY
jgi:hypothetical protein